MEKATSYQFAKDRHLHEFLDLVNKAIELSQDEHIDDLEAISTLGQGWVAEETLAIAIYCSLKYCNDFDNAVIAAVNHSGDRDSTGAVTRNIVEAYLGLKDIPQRHLDNLELKDVILDIADDLFYDCEISDNSSCRDEIWEQKYIFGTYKPNRHK